MQKAKYIEVTNYLNNKRDKLQCIENKVILSFENEELVNEKCFLHVVLCRTKIIRLYLKLNNMHTISCTART